MKTNGKTGPAPQGVRRPDDPAPQGPHRPGGSAPQGLRRPDGPAKLTGAALYTADRPHPDALVAALVTATVPTGRLAALDTAAAERAPGVVRVIRHQDMPRLNPMPSPPMGHTVLVMQDDRIHYEGQPVAVVLARTWEQARYAASLVDASYEDVVEPVMFGAAPEIEARGPMLLREEPDVGVGDVEAGLARADVVVDATYTTSDRHANAIEPPAVLAWWEEDRLTLHVSTQAVALTQGTVAALFGVAPQNVTVHSPYVGGGFGSKAFLQQPVPLAVAAARVAGRPVRLVLTRAQTFTLCGHQAATRQRVRIGARRDGRLTALEHRSTNATTRAADYHIEAATAGSGSLYASPAIALKARVEQVDRPAPTPMRSPNEGVGLFALESAMDELSYELGMDPVELRIRNEPTVHPMTGRPFSSRRLVECLREGARRFGWDGRPPAGSLREGDDLIGWGVATAVMDSFRGPAAARIRAGAGGRIVVETGTEEIGTGIPAMVQAVASQALGIGPADIEVRHGSSDLPAHGGVFGSMTTMSVGSAVHVAATALREKLTAAGGFEGMRQAGIDTLEAEGNWAPEASAHPNGTASEVSALVYGAFFAEVRVDADLGLVRMTRGVGVYSAGRIINPLAARSQLTGGIIWGLGQALRERSVMEPGRGRFLHKNLAGYVVPVHADIGDLDVSFIEDEDRHASAIGAKGIGEIGSNGTAAAIANAVHHATGRRIRSLPITAEDLL
ncbi:xanthine dehydrogenase family protein molybdopterin-binding subunit [Streptomyces sp. MST-110588]|uniref:xanthine dehydrogenase family protein molybdopterin-binding subunit n=1 Tax=Streptomyces sp. MST-110588 TaxID=2833628 RepID=UPI001F5D9FFF|nr:xanthine dehydrogenase family protein molybdopterin-binding subunit [Streptomyces sp. MST-110588]UNO38476.1 xanthine dehydrogenase family protein molybdopterin-binding subunit [Streptomyces sp. MST-110588]